MPRERCGFNFGERQPENLVLYCARREFGSYKNGNLAAVMNTMGLAIRVPLFIAPGEVVRVDVRTGRYVERARAERKRGA